MTRADVGHGRLDGSAAVIAACECEIAGVKCYMCVLCNAAVSTAIVGSSDLVPARGGGRRERCYCRGAGVSR